MGRQSKGEGIEMGREGRGEMKNEWMRKGNQTVTDEIGGLEWKR